MSGIKIPPKRTELSNKAAVQCSRRLRGLSPLPISPLVKENKRTRANSLSALQLGADALPDSPSRSPSVLRQERRGSVIVHSNSNSGASTPRSGEWDNYTEQPTFWNSRFGWISHPEKVRLVSTESDSSTLALFASH